MSQGGPTVPPARRNTMKTVDNQITIEETQSSTDKVAGSLSTDAQMHRSAAIPNRMERKFICCGQ